jgi:hypothetical protein
MDAFAALRSRAPAGSSIGGYLVLQPAGAARRALSARPLRETGLIESTGTLLIGVVAALIVCAFFRGPASAPHASRLAYAQGAPLTGAGADGTLAAIVLDEAPATPAPSAPSAVHRAGPPPLRAFPAAEVVADTPPAVQLAMAPLPDELAAVPPETVPAVAVPDAESTRAAASYRAAKTAHGHLRHVRLYRASSKTLEQANSERRPPPWAQQMYETPWQSKAFAYAR